jgi:hypothetical protein
MLEDWIRKMYRQQTMRKAERLARRWDAIADEKAMMRSHYESIRQLYNGASVIPLHHDLVEDKIRTYREAEKRARTRAADIRAGRRVTARSW